jgi:hypothetical protein
MEEEKNDAAGLRSLHGKNAVFEISSMSFWVNPYRGQLSLHTR